MTARKLTALFALPVLVSAAQAQTAPPWIVGDASTLTFVAIQQGAPFEGRFERFSVELEFAPDALQSSRLVVTVELGSVDTRYADRDEVLRAPEFFDVARWPAGRFVAREFSPIGDHRFEAAGELTIRDETHPFVVPFEFVADGTQASLTGQVVLPRLRFGIGQGEWADTTWIGADVNVRFDLRLQR